MKKIKMKIVDWDKENLNLIVKFSSDENPKSIDEYTPLAYQPINMFPGIENVEELTKRVAVSGIHICEMETLREKAQSNEKLKDEFSLLVGKTFEYDIDDLLNMDKQEITLEDLENTDEYEDLVQEDSKIKTIDV